MGNNLLHEFTADNNANYRQPLEAGEAKQDDSSTRRKTSASVDEIRNLYSALQELVPSQARPPTTASHGAIPEETSTRKVDTVECDVVSRSPKPSSGPAFKKNHRCSSSLPMRSQPKVIQRKRSNSCFVISATPNSLAPPSADSFHRERRSSNSSTDSQRMNEELSNLIENFDKETISRVKGERNDLRSDGSEVEKSWSKRRHSGGDLLEERRERLKDPRFKARRRSIGGSLLLNTIIESDSSRQDSLANALSIIARKDELQEIFKKSQENSEHENENNGGVSESFDEVDGMPKQQLITQKNPDSLMCLTNENPESVGNSSDEKEKNSDVKTRAKVGAEMHNLLEALQELVVSGEGTTPPASSQTISRKISWVEKSSPKRRESLDELEAFFKNKLDEISKKENDETSTKCAQEMTKEMTKTLQVRNKDNSNNKKGKIDKNRVRKSLSLERNTGTSSIHRSQSTVQFLNPAGVDKARPVGARRASVQIEVNTTHLGRSNSTFEVVSSQSSLRKEKKVATGLNNSVSSRSRRRKSDIPILRREEVLSFKTTDEDSAHQRALWKEDQKVFAKQVNQRLQDWLERATALSLSTTEDESAPQILTDTNPENSKDENVKTKRAKFAVKKAFQGRVKRSKSLHNILEPEEIQVEKPKTRSPLIERSKQNIRKLGRLRILRSKSMHNIAAMIPKVEKTETKSIESDTESTESSSCNIRRSTIWYDDDSSPEMVPKVKSIDISGENLNIDHFSRRRSCPTPNNFVNNSIDCKRISRLPVDLPLFYAPGTEPSNLRIQKKVENCRQNSIEKENKMPRTSKALFPVKREIKKEMFYNEAKVPRQLFPNTLSQTMKEMSIAQTKTSEGQYMMFQNYDLSKLSVSNDFESLEEFRDRTKSTESEDSGCPNTADYC